MHNYLELYWLECYLFNKVSQAFKQNKKLSAFDFFCIIIWKANRAKSKVALKLLRSDKESRKDLNAIVEDLTASIYNAISSKERLKILVVEWGFRLPMASAILTVLYPDDFTVYDVRVCNVLNNFHNIQDKTSFEDLWQGYENFQQQVKDRPVETLNLSLRNKDRYLWGESFSKDLEQDIENLFGRDDDISGRNMNSSRQ